MDGVIEILKIPKKIIPWKGEYQELSYQGFFNGKKKEKKKSSSKNVHLEIKNTPKHFGRSLHDSNFNCIPYTSLRDIVLGEDYECIT